MEVRSAKIISRGLKRGNMCNGKSRRPGVEITVFCFQLSCEFGQTSSTASHDCWRAFLGRNQNLNINSSSSNNNYSNNDDSRNWR